MNQSTASTRRRILDAAKVLYGTEGVGATSLRAIVKEANVNLNAINYHFGSKDHVTEHLFKDIMSPINAERNHLLDSISALTPNSRELMYAIYWPIFRRAVESEESRCQLIIVNQIRQDPSSHAREVVARNLDEFVPQFETLLSKATKVSKSKLRIPIRLMVASAWGLVTQSIVIDDLAFNKTKRVQAKVFDQFLDFATNGFAAVTT